MILAPSYTKLLMSSVSSRQPVLPEALRMVLMVHLLYRCRSHRAESQIGDGARTAGLPFLDAHKFRLYRTTCTVCGVAFPEVRATS